MPARKLLPLVVLITTLWIPTAPAVEITHGPILGQPGAHQMAVWARTDAPGEFRVRYRVSPDGPEQVSDPVTTKLAHDNTAYILLTDLEADTLYNYQVFTDETEGPSATFRTFPDPELLKDPELNPNGLFNFAFEFACGNNQSPEHGPGPALLTYDTLNALVRNQILFQILNGDWLYEELRDYPLVDWQRAQNITPEQTPFIPSIAPSIVGVWENYKLYLSRAANLAEFHRYVPAFYTIDDHEIVNDIYGPATAGFRNRRAVFRDIGGQAWQDYLAWSNPVEFDRPAHFGVAELEEGSDVLTDSNADFTALPLDEMTTTLHVHWEGPNAGVKDPEPDESEANPNFNVYDIVEVISPTQVRISPAAVATNKAPYSIGRRHYGKFRVANCEFYLLDTRSHRDLHDFDNPAREDVSMIGEKQFDWLVESMKQSDADFHFVVSSVNFMVPHVGAGGGGDFNEAAGKKDDAWTVFLHDRERLIDFWDSLGTPVFVLTGDLHNSFACKITENVYEFAAGPHNSVNHRPVEDEGNRPANGPFQWGPRPCEILWSTYVMSDIPREHRIFPHYCVVQIRNVFDNPLSPEETRLVAFPKPYVVFQYHDGLTGELVFAHSVHAPGSAPEPQ